METRSGVDITFFWWGGYGSRREYVRVFGFVLVLLVIYQPLVGGFVSRCTLSR